MPNWFSGRPTMEDLRYLDFPRTTHVFLNNYVRSSLPVQEMTSDQQLDTQGEKGHA
jgi:hypothetical protein